MTPSQAMLTRRTVHDWAPLPVPELIVKRAIEAAHAAPCHKFTWPWRFNWAGPVAREQLFELGVQLKCPQGAPSPRLLSKLTSKLKNPAHLVAVSQVLDADLDRQREDYAACACAVQNMMLSVHADGFASKWGSGSLTCHARAYELLGVDPALERVVAFVWIGVPHLVPDKPARSPLTSHLRRTP